MMSFKQVVGKHCKLFLLAAALISFGFATVLYRSKFGNFKIKDINFNNFIKFGSFNRRVDPVYKNSTYSRKWVVITSIYKPTRAIKVFSEIPGWQLLVVGDKKTPADWKFKNVIYLGVEEQEQLPYATVRHVPWNRYTRKIIGYLYAIQHGAEYIYESDDDNVPNQSLSLFRQTHPYRLIVSTQNLTFNPYAHFGQSSTWPRGYPLDRIGMPHPHEYISCPTDPPTIVQSLVNGDPDMDAIYRLTRLHSTVHLDIYFDKRAPLYLHPAGTFSPFNSQNTLFHKKAFWGLLLPVSVTDRATDIYRSYWTQRLMWLIKQRLAFGPATFYQKRSNHNLLNDFDQEKELYKDVGNFIKALNLWKCSSTSFEMCILEATKIVVDGGYWSNDDYELVEAWISDLKQLDSSLLDFHIEPQDDGCIENKKQLLVFYPSEQITSMNNDPGNGMPPFATNDDVVFDKLESQCGFVDMSYRKYLNNESSMFSNVILVVSIYAAFDSTIPKFEAFYKLHFKKIVYCTELHVSQGFLEKWKLTTIFFKPGELSMLSCLTSASLMNFNVQGFLHLSDFMWFNVSSRWTAIDLQSVWLPKTDSLFTIDDSKVCGNRNTRCKKLTLKTVNQFWQNINDKTSFVLRNETRKRFKTSLQKMKDMLSQTRELSILTDVIAYLPNNKAHDLYLMKTISTKFSWNPVEVLTRMLFDFYGADVVRLHEKTSNKTGSYYDFRSDVKEVNFLDTEFCTLFNPRR